MFHIKYIIIIALLAIGYSTTSTTTNNVKQFNNVVPVFSSNAVIVNTWEPQIAVSNSNNVYIFATNVGGVPSCLTCGEDPIMYRKTNDYGMTWQNISSNMNQSYGYVYNQSLTWFADSVAYSDQYGNLYLSYIGYSKGSLWKIFFQKSIDGGMSWSIPTVASGNISADKNWMAIDENNEYYYITFNSQNPYASVSYDGGKSFSDPIQIDEINTNYFYANGGCVISNGSVAFGYVATPNAIENDSVYDDDTTDDNGSSNATTSNFTYARVYISNDHGLTYIKYNISTYIDNQKCPSWGQCAVDYFTGSSNLAADVDDNIYFVYNGDDNSTSTIESRVMMSIKFFNSSQFSTPFDVSDAPTGSNVYHFSTMVSGGITSGNVRVAWMDNRTSYWNVFYRESNNFGQTWSNSVQLSTNFDYQGFQTEKGFLFPYGDYGSLKVDSSGNSHVVWGEGLYWYGGGTVMYTTQASSSSPSPSPSSPPSSSSLSTSAKIAISVVMTAIGTFVMTIAMLHYIGHLKPFTRNKIDSNINSNDSNINSNGSSINSDLTLALNSSSNPMTRTI